jgi:pyruvate dehydrogenase E1 component beta subunit
VPGLITLTPYNSRDARGLLKAAIRNPNPVVFLENEMMYGDLFELTEEEMGMDFVLPIGKGNIERKGDHITLVAYAKVFQ